MLFREIAFLAVLNFFPVVQKLIIGHFWNCQKWSLAKMFFFREIDLFDFTSFFGLDFLKFSGPLWKYSCQTFLAAKFEKI